jgi:RHS repeat-associated protein
MSHTHTHRFLNCLLIAVLSTFVLSVSSALGAPNDPFNGASARFDEPREEATNLNLGDWGVAEQRGAATYTLPLAVPPGRRGMEPRLALRYSSRSPLRGGIAAGWTLDLPSVTLDRSLGHEDKASFRASLGYASGRLVEVPEAAQFGSRAYRVEFDDSFTRFFNPPDGALSTWTALTTDGVRHFFGDEENSRHRFSRWLITRQVDPHGNTVHYFWTRIDSGPNVDYSLQRIEYTSNPSAGLAAHAKVEFTYAPLDRCDGSELPIGAAPAADGAMVVEGARRLVAVTTSVRDLPVSAWRVARRVELEYRLRSSVLHFQTLAPDPSPEGLFCTQARMRYLTGIRTTAFTRQGAETSLPATTFTYNDRRGGGPLGPAPFETRTVTEPGLGDYGHEKGAVGTLLDLDSDGVRDRVSVTEEGETCTLVWQKGLDGGRFESQKRKSPLPTAPWSDDPDLVPEDHVHQPARVADEQCTLNGQVTFRHKEVSDNQDLGYTHERGVLSYHFLDYTGDGRVDLLTNVWATIQHDTFVPAGDGPPGAAVPGAPLVMTPEGPWRVYRNAGDPDANPFTPAGAVFSVRPFRVDMPAFGGADCAPEALPPSAADNLLSKTHVPDVSISPLTDLDGDGFLDIVDLGKSTGGLRFDGEWCVWFGTGGREFSEAYRWPVPELRLSLGERGYNEEEVESSGERHVKRTTAAALQDMNGDGLADLVVQTLDQQLKTYLNTGSGFRLQPLELGLSSPVDVVQTDFFSVGDVVRNGNRGYRLRLVDVDGDWLPDLVTTTTPDDDVAGPARVFVRFNSGDRFLPRVEVPARWAEAQRLLRYADGEWHLATDFFDANGDGQEDLASWASDGSRLTVSDSPGLPPAADLLESVENGRGLRISFDYGISTDPKAVSWDNGAARTPFDLPQPTWVVSAMSVSGGFGTPGKVTRFAYANPVLRSTSEDTGRPEPERFVGMGRAQLDVRTSGVVPARETTRRYAYDQSGAPGGRIVEERLYNGAGKARRLHKQTLNDWEREPLFQGRTYFVHLASALTRTCLPGVSEAACIAQTENVHRSQQTWEPRSCGSAAEALYVRAIEREGIGVSAGDNDRRTLYDHLVRCGPDYHVLVERALFQQARPGPGGIAFETRGETRTSYDTKGMPIRTAETQDVGVVATTERTFDPATGNLIELTKPEQAASGGSGKGTVYTYDARALFVDKTVNELGHEVFTKHDVATGSLLERRGPNAVTLPSGETVREGEAWRIDGLGRTVAYSKYFDDEAAGYVLQTVTKTGYFDAELPNRVRTEQLRDLGGSVSLTADTTTDGLGRALVETEHLDGGRRAVTTYAYDGDGNVTAVEVPDPRSDGARVRYVYGYDGLGRSTSLTRPDGSGISVAYPGLDKTVSEVAGDGSGSTRKQIFDALGRLIEVHELYPTAATAVTRYRYDGRDNLVRITDADGNVTSLAHDFVSRRTAIVRGDRAWRYAYDRNGNLLTEVSPKPAAADPALFTTSYRFDDLDRKTAERFADVRDPTRPGGKAPATIRYVYDEGPNGVGRLRQVVLPFGQIGYGYDARGLVTSEQRSFALSGIATASDSQRVQRTYNALGQLTRSVWDDGQQWRIGYDGRGLAANVQWLDPAASALRQVAAFDRSLAGQPRVRDSSFGQERRYTYDALGRLVQDSILARDGSPALATRGYTFTGSGDLASVTGATNGVSAAASYTYDAQHRLTGASGPNGYTGSFTYAPAGNLLTANVGWNGSSESRNVRYEYGTRDPQAVDRLVDVRTGNAYADFRYDLAGNMIERDAPGGATSLDWDGLDRLRVARNAKGREVYFYDHTGARMLAVSSTDGIRFWFGESETHYRLDGTQTRRYLHLSDGGSALARVENRTKIELQYADALQNLTLALDRDGDVVASFLYGPFGEVVKAQGDPNHRRQFNGKENDPLTSLRYYGFRYYDPLALRWNTADPLYQVVPDLGMDEPQRMNLYTFSMNNPLRYYDPDGRQGKDESEDESQASADSTAAGCVMVEGGEGGPECVPVDEDETIDEEDAIDPTDVARTIERLDHEYERRKYKEEELDLERDRALAQLHISLKSVEYEADQYAKSKRELREAEGRLAREKAVSARRVATGAVLTGIKCATSGPVGCSVSAVASLGKAGRELFRLSAYRRQIEETRGDVESHRRSGAEAGDAAWSSVGRLIDIAEHRERP